MYGQRLHVGRTSHHSWANLLSGLCFLLSHIMVDRQIVRVLSTPRSLSIDHLGGLVKRRRSTQGIFHLTVFLKWFRFGLSSRTISLTFCPLETFHWGTVYYHFAAPAVRWSLGIDYTVDALQMKMAYEIQPSWSDCCYGAGSVAAAVSASSAAVVVAAAAAAAAAVALVVEPSALIITKIPCYYQGRFFNLLVIHVISYYRAF